LAAFVGTRTGATGNAPATASPSPTTETSTADMLQEDNDEGLPVRSRARTYEIPQASASAAAGLAGTQIDSGSGAVDGDLQDYHQLPRAQTLAPDVIEEPRVVVEDEEPRRRGFAWIPLLLGLGLVLLLALLLFNQYRSRSTAVASVTSVGAQSTADAGLGAAATSAAAGTAGSAGARATSNVKAVTTAEPTTGVAGGAGQAMVTSPSVSRTVTPSGNQTIIVVAPHATLIPPTATPTPPPATSSATPVDVAAANPTVTSPQTVIQAGPWSFTYTGKQNTVTGSYGGARPVHGQYQIVLLQVANNSGQPAKIPDGFFVIKDAQGHVYNFNRAASVDYLNRFGGPGAAADVGADARFPSNQALTSVALLFDVSPDTRNLVLFSRNNPNQGFLIR
jgi:hypothetical protein